MVQIESFHENHSQVAADQRGENYVDRVYRAGWRHFLCRPVLISYPKRRQVKQVKLDLNL